jgi:hypothetical protein
MEHDPLFPDDQAMPIWHIRQAPLRGLPLIISGKGTGTFRKGIILSVS